MFLFESVSLPLFLFELDLVDTSEPPTVVENTKLVSEIIASTILLTVVPAFVVNDNLSLTLNSVLNLVPKPVTVLLLFAIDIVPVICKLSPYVLSNLVSAVYVGDPSIPSCLVDEKSNEVTPLKPLAFAWIVAVLDEIAPVIVSPGVNVPDTLDKTTTDWSAIPPLVYELKEEPFTSNSKFEAVGFFTVYVLPFNCVIPTTAEIVTCCPSFKVLDDVITTGLAAVAPVIVWLLFVEIFSYVPVAAEVLPVIFSPLVNDWFFATLICVNITRSNK